jgi:hypothetical protein
MLEFADAFLSVCGSEMPSTVIGTESIAALRRVRLESKNPTAPSGVRRCGQAGASGTAEAIVNVLFDMVTQSV